MESRQLEDKAVNLDDTDLELDISFYRLAVTWSAYL